jgi:hypothetical protein
MACMHVPAPRPTAEQALPFPFPLPRLGIPSRHHHVHARPRRSLIAVFCRVYGGFPLLTVTSIISSVHGSAWLRGPAKVCGAQTKFSAFQQPCYCTSLKLRATLDRIDQGQTTLFSDLGLCCLSVRPSLRPHWPAFSSTLTFSPLWRTGLLSATVASCNVPGRSAEHCALPPCKISAPLVVPTYYWQARGLVARSHRTDCPRSGVTPNPSLHNLTAPKAARSRNHLFEASNKLSPYMTWLHESLFRISLSLHVGLISFSMSLIRCF